jgi:hypothetical protein
VKVEEVRMCIEIVEKWGMEDKRIRESNGNG